MAKTTDDILTLAELKSELRIPLETTSQDSMLQSQIGSGIAFLSHPLPAPILEESRTARVVPGDDQTPLVFAAAGFKGVTQIKYWTPAVSLRDAPDGTIAGADLGRVHQQQDRRSAIVYPPASGWPSVLIDSHFEVVYVTGVGDPDIPGFRGALVAYCRFVYDGYREVKPHESFIRLSRHLGR